MLRISPHRVDAGMPREKLNAVKLVSTARSARIVTRILRIVVLLFVAILFVPWQQHVDGKGQLTALAPQDRPQMVQSPIAGRIDRWYVQEGQRVKAGDTLVVLSEIKEKFLDPDLVPRLREQVGAKQGVIRNTIQKADALGNQIGALQSGLRLKLEQARNKVIQAQLKVRTDSMELIAGKVQYAISDTQLTLGSNMYKKGLISLADYQRRQEKFQQNSAKFIGLENKLLESKNQLLNAQIELNALRADYMEKTSKAESDRNTALAYVAEAEGDLAKLENEYSSMLIRNSFYVIRAPQDGYVVKAVKAGIGENLKENDPVVTIMPANPRLAVEVYITATDIPLVQPGNKVRVRFDGWPAIVFSGWPGASVGTFGGVVQNVDAVESSNGMFRILVVPDKADDPWPPALRMGSNVYAWAMLENVPVWYELWRQLNGFPPDLPKEESASAKGDKP